MLSYLTTGTAQASTGTGDIVITGCPFTPKAAIFYANRRSADGAGADAYLGFGFADGTNQGAFSFSANDSAASGDITVTQRADRCLLWSTLNGAVLYAVSFNAWTSDGVVLNTATTNGTTNGFTVLLLGGEDLTNVNCGFFQKTSTTAGLPFTQDITGIGFQPDCVILGQIRQTATMPSAAQANMTGGIGWAVNNNGVTQQAYSAFKDDNGVNPINGAQRQTTSSCFLQFSATNNDNTIVSEANLNSFISDGFRLEWTTQSAAVASYVLYLALKGGNYASGSITQPTSTGIVGVNGLGFQPSALLVQSFGRAASGSVVNSIYHSVGMTDFNSQRTWSSSEPDNVTPGQAASTLNGSAVWESYERTTQKAKATYQHQTPDGFTLNFDTVDATSREIIYLAFGKQMGKGSLSSGGVG